MGDQARAVAHTIARWWAACAVRRLADKQS